MPRAEFVTMQVPTSPGVGAAREVEDLDQKSIQFIGPFVATFDVEGSLDPAGSTFGAVQTGIMAPSFTSGTPQALLGGRNSRTR